jgi:hypothetical protein
MIIDEKRLSRLINEEREPVSLDSYNPLCVALAARAAIRYLTEPAPDAEPVTIATRAGEYVPPKSAEVKRPEPDAEQRGYRRGYAQAQEDAAKVCEEDGNANRVAEEIRALAPPPPDASEAVQMWAVCLPRQPDEPPIALWHSWEQAESRARCGGAGMDVRPVMVTIAPAEG